MSGFPACSRDARRPGEVSAPGLAVLLGRAWAAASRGVAFPAVVLHPAAVSHAPAQFSSTQEQETAPAPPGNKLSQPLPRKKNYPGNPGRPVAAFAGGAAELRVVPVAVAAGVRACQAVRKSRPALAAYPVGGRLRAKSIFRVPNYTSTERNYTLRRFWRVNPVNFPHLARVGPLYDKKVYLPRTHPIYTTAPSVNPWRRGKSYFSPTRQAGLLDGRAVIARNPALAGGARDIRPCEKLIWKQVRLSFVSRR